MENISEKVIKGIFLIYFISLVIIASDISPIDVISHLPVLCEENKIPYVFVPTKNELGTAAGTKRPTSCIMLNPDDKCDFKDKYDKIIEKINV